MKVLLVEDEKHLAEALLQILKKNKYTVDGVYNGEDGLDYALTGIYDVIILDIMLPKLSGLEILKSIRKKKISTPVLLLTAKSEVSDRVKGLDLGADDYLPKPFSTEELLARLRALTRRKGEVINEDTLSFSNFSLNLSTYLLEGEKTSVRLALKEVEILKYFMLRPRIIVNKEDLIIKVWGYESEAENNNIEVYISFLRKKLQYIEARAKITTIRGVGYKLEEE
ncbi:response regulator transcription factor [Alkaliphilus oremlandii]|uniref:Stage 0 sporulation protein A homolog n=1 Tax=Alkaliphilus oremlandii (strain OhILAs) TaxID=350688 RepID=A8ML70_ALKOO|nr:response regulator transcription factor [Alkaliphilus oremlandii]ABW17887.1 two component transcriptional regulator, winged helix family [Alkaliphilus oremlandii OhILAs]